MESQIKRSVASILAVLVLLLPAGLAAKGRRGATLVVTKLDGRRDSGELIAVKPDTLLLLGGGTDVSVALADIQTVRLVRKSRAGAGMLLGLLAGAAGGAAWGAANKDDDVYGEYTPLIAGAYVGAIGLAAGALVGLAMGADSTITIAGRSEADQAMLWDKLRAHSREGRLKRAARPPGL